MSCAASAATLSISAERRVGRGADPRLGRLDLRPDLARRPRCILSSVAWALAALAAAATFSASARLSSIRAR